jgi:bifunctional non-homologous end joining protein LigD
MRGEGHVHFAAFDILWLNGRDLRHLPLTQRKRRLSKLIPVTTGTLSTIMTVEERGCDLFQAVCHADFEGIVAKRRADPYSERTQWWKIKNPAYTQAADRRRLFEKGLN